MWPHTFAHHLITAIMGPVDNEHSMSIKISLFWIPTHVVITDNEAADHSANTGPSSTDLTTQFITFDTHQNEPFLWKRMVSYSSITVVAFRLQTQTLP